jgi:hypothetical protein
LGTFGSFLCDFLGTLTARLAVNKFPSVAEKLSAKADLHYLSVIGVIRVYREERKFSFSKIVKKTTCKVCELQKGAKKTLSVF